MKKKCLKGKSSFRRERKKELSQKENHCLSEDATICNSSL